MGIPRLVIKATIHGAALIVALIVLVVVALAAKTFLHVFMFNLSCLYYFVTEITDVCNVDMATWQR